VKELMFGSAAALLCFSAQLDAFESHTRCQDLMTSLDYVSAFSPCSSAASQGHLSAIHDLAILYGGGLGVAQDYAEAVRLLTIAAERGYALSQFQLGLMHTSGAGVPRNNAEGVRLITLAARQGLSRAQYHLGLIYASGSGVAQDYVEAHMWFNIAAATGSGGGARNVAELMMTPQQIAEAQARATRCMRSGYVDC
jgi:uncharacterized protein